MGDVKRELREGDSVRVVNPLSSCHGKTGVVEHIGEAEQLGWVGVRIPESNFHVMKAGSVERVATAEASAQGEAGRVELRASVRWFAEEMEFALRRNDHKGGWHECSPHSLIARVLEEGAELVESVEPDAQNKHDFECASRNARFAANMIAGCGYFMSTTSVADTIREAADVGAIAMMVADHFREGGPSLDQGHTLSPPPKAEP